MTPRSKSRLLLSLPIIFAVANAFGVERRPGSITLSDGGKFQGDVWFGNGEIKVYEGEDAEGGKYVRLAQDKIGGIVFSVKQATMERPWRFKNAGSDEKEYLPGEYPLVNLRSDVKTTNGELLRGHVMSVPVFVRVQDREVPTDFETKKFVLKYQHKGETGQTQKDIVYVTSITFTDSVEKATAKYGSISGTIKGNEKLEEVAAFGIQRDHAYPGTIDPKTQSFKIENLPEDTYEIALRTDRAGYVGLSDVNSTPKEKQRPLEKDDAEAIDKQLKTFDDFFDTLQVVAIKGDREAAKVLVHLSRKKPIYDQQSIGDNEIHRVEIWMWHMGETDWHVNQDGRQNLFRYTDPHKGPQRKIIVSDALAGVAVAGENKTIEFHCPESTGVPKK